MSSPAPKRYSPHAAALASFSTTTGSLTRSLTWAANGSSTRIGPFTFWFWAPIWFASHTRYFQRRQNILAEVIAARSIGAPAPTA